MKISKLLVAGLIICSPVLQSKNSIAASSDWLKVPGGEMRLVSAANPESLVVDAALEIKLKKGWKTYWRAPGDSGIPPQFSFGGSQNLASAGFDFPTPSYFNEKGTQTVGYKDRVVFPISVNIIEQSEPLVLELSAVIGICAEICVPVQAKLSLVESGTIGPSFEVSRIINNAKYSVPTQPLPDFRLVSANWDIDKPKELLISAVVPDGSSSVQMHVEGPQDWYLLPAKMLDEAGENGEFQFLLDISDIPGDAKPASTKLRFTLVADGRGVEQLLVPSQ